VNYLYILAGISPWIIFIFFQVGRSELAGLLFCGTFHSNFSWIYWGQSYCDLCRCLKANYFGALVDVSQWFISVFCWMSDSELSWYSVGCLMVNYLGCLTANYAIILLYVLWPITQYFVRCLTPHYVGILFDVSRWIFSVFCQMSDGELYWYFVRCLTVNYFDILPDVSWWIISVFFWISDCELCLYFVGCLTVNFPGMVSEIL